MRSRVPAPDDVPLHCARGRVVIMSIIIIAIKSQGCLQAGKCRPIESVEDAITGDEWTARGTREELSQWAAKQIANDQPGGNGAYERRVGRNVRDLLEAL